MKIISTETDNVGASSSTTASASLPVISPDRSYHSNDSATSGTDSDTDDDQPTQKALGKPGPDISKTNWKFWSSEHLKSLVLKAKGGVSDAVLAFIKSTMKDTKLIFVMGGAGTGKSSLLNELTGMDLHVGKSLGSGTRQYHVCPAVIDNQQYLFIDTAGFGAADLDNERNFQDIMGCLSVLGPFVTVAGVLFVYGRMERLLENDLRTMRWIECFCGPNFFQNIMIVTTKWDELVEDDFEDRWAITADFENYDVVRCLLKPPGRLHGATVYHHGFPEDKDIGELQIVRELNQKRALCDTEAGKVLTSNLDQTIVEVSEDSATLVPRPGSGKDDGVPLRQATVNNSSRESNDTRDTKTRDQSEHAKEQFKGQSEQPPHEEAKKQPKNRPKSQAKEEPSWFQRWFRSASDWWTVLSEAARFFAEARKGGYQSSNRTGGGSAPAWNPWKAARNWWNGTSA
ncbi:hypothetical protein CcaCcLH18_06425 [Colletotrichum camelliae]|nr:hypothetical protein CcaCcLH18_06425 [Colletotrichum camelliae]